VALQEKYEAPSKVCPCINQTDDRIPMPPSFIGNHYFCGTGAITSFHGIFHSHNPLWDKQGCKGANQCCTFNSPPWFYRELPGPNTREPIKMKVSLDESAGNEDIAIRRVDLYVQ